MSAKRPHLLLVEALFYEHIATDLRRGAERAVAEAGATCEVISVPGSFEVPVAIAMAPPEPPSPMTTDTIGTLAFRHISVDRAMASAWPRSSAPTPG